MVHLRVAGGWVGGAASSPAPTAPVPLASLDVTVVEDTCRLPEDLRPLVDVEPPGNVQLLFFQSKKSASDYKQI